MRRHDTDASNNALVHPFKLVGIISLNAAIFALSDTCSSKKIQE